MRLVYEMVLLHNVFFKLVFNTFLQVTDDYLEWIFCLYLQGPLSSLQGMDAGTLKSAMVRNGMLFSDLYILLCKDKKEIHFFFF